MMPSSAVPWAARIESVMVRLRGGSLAAVLVRGASGSFMLSVVGVGLGFVTHVLLARIMGYENYGDYNFVFAWLAVLALLTETGLDKTLLRYLAVYKAEENWARFRGLLRFSHLTVLGTSLGLALLTAAFAPVAGRLYGREVGLTFAVAAATLPLLGLATLRQGAVQALRRVVEAQLGLTVLRPVAQLAVAAVVWMIVGRRGLTSPEAMGAYVAAAAAALALNAVQYRRYLPAASRSGRRDYVPGEWMAMALPMVFMAGTTMALRQAPVAMLGMELDRTQSGLFAAATRLVDLIAFGLLAVNAIAAPIFAELYHRGRREELQHILTLAAWFITAISLPVAVGLLLFGEPLLGLFGPEFKAAYVAMAILVFGQVVNAATGSVGYLLTMTGHQGKAAAVVCGVFILAVILNAVLIPRYGIEGAAAATSGANVCWNLALLVIVVRVLRVNPTVFRLPVRRKSETDLHNS